MERPDQHLELSIYNIEIGSRPPVLGACLRNTPFNLAKLAKLTH